MRMMTLLIITTTNNAGNVSTIIKRHSSTSFHSSYFQNNNSKSLKKESLKENKKKILSCFCSIAFLLPCLLASTVTITFITIFIVNYFIPQNTSNEMSGFLTTESTNRIKERLQFITKIPPKVVYILNDIQSYTLFINNLQKHKEIVKKVYINYPEISSINILNNNTYEQIFYERLPNSTIYEGYRYPNKFNDTNLERYIVDNKTLNRIEGWGPSVITNNFIARERTWYIECEGKINYWSKVIIYSTGQLALSRCTSFFSDSPKNNKSSSLNFLGLMTVDITLGNLHIFLKSFTVGKTGLSFIMERDNGNLIASSVGSLKEGSVDSRINVVNSTVDTVRIIGTTILKDNLENITTVKKFINVNGEYYVSYFFWKDLILQFTLL